MVKEGVEGPAARSVRRSLGAYYTPDAIARALAEWAVPAKGGRVLDPSFGGCSFLRAALSCEVPDTQMVEVFGVDLDSEGAGRHAGELITQGVPRQNFVLKDFFATSLADFGDKGFDAVIGNPPYIRHHSIEDSNRRLASDAVATLGLTLPKRSDLWAYFVPYASSYLVAGGRFAFVLPAAFLHASYAHPIVNWLTESFQSVRIIEIEERLFDEAAEASVIVAASGYGLGPASHYHHGRAKDAAGLVAALLDDASLHRRCVSEQRPWAFDLLAPQSLAAWTRLCDNEKVRRLGSLAEIRIGAVTGANGFFVRHSGTMPAVNGDGPASIRVVPRSSDLAMAIIRQSDLDRFDELGRKSYMILLPEERSELEEILTEAEAAGLDQRYHCRGRQPWWVLKDVAKPDAFLGYMGANPGRVVLNQADASCTNTIHRLTWTDSVESPAAIAVGSWTSLYELGAELYGRWYGGGVLKLEPSEAARIPIPIISDAVDLANEIDSLARNGEGVKAVRLADDTVLKAGLGASEEEVMALRTAVTSLRSRRTGGRS